MSDSEVARESHDSEKFEIIGDERDVVPDKSVVEEEEDVLKENGDVDMLQENSDVYNGESDHNKQNGIGQHGPLDEPADDQPKDEEPEVKEEEEVLEPQPEQTETEEFVEQVEEINNIPELIPSQEEVEEEEEEKTEQDITPVAIEGNEPPAPEPEPEQEPEQEEKEPESRKKFGKSIIVKPRIPSKTKTGRNENSQTIEAEGEKSEANKLVDSKFFEDKENETTKEKENDNKPKRGPSRRLDMSRFSRFEQKTADSTDSIPAWKKNRGSVNSSAAAKKFAIQNQDASSLNECKVCSKRVYPMERLTADGVAYHKSCFKCTECKATLRLGTFAMAKGHLYCKPHFKQLFKLKGNYDDAFTPGANRPEFSVGEDNDSPSTNGVSQNASNPSEQGAEEVFDMKNRRSRFDGTEQKSTTVTKIAGPPVDFPVAGSSGQVAESEPIQRSDVVREGDLAEETSVGSMRSLKDRFEQGKVSNVEVRKSFNPENEKIVVESDGTSHISENQPLVREGVVKSSQELDEACTMQGGMRAVKDRFESGKLSEATEKKIPEPIDLTAEVEASNASARNSILAENEPITREGVVRSVDDVNEVKVITGGIGSLKNRFEKGGVSNVESVKKQEPERVIRSLENYTESESSDGHVAESTPVERTDITRESTEVDDGISQGGARSLRDIFEKGNVSNVTDKPKEKIQVRSEIEGAGQVAESQPIVRSDVMKADMEMSEEFSVGVSKSLKNKFEKGEVHNSEGTPKSELERPPRSLEEFASGDSQVSENTPAPPMEGIYRSTMADDSVDSIEGGTRNLKEKWEKGEVINVAQDKKQPLEREPKSIDLYKSDEGQVAENEPLVREGIYSGSSDLIEPMSPAAGAVDLKNKWEKGEVHNAEIAVPMVDISPRRLSDSFDGQEVNGNKEINGEVENGWTQDSASVEIKASRSVAMEQEDL